MPLDILVRLCVMGNPQAHRRTRISALQSPGSLQANGLFHTNPGQRPGFIARFAVAGQRPASSQVRMSRAFSAPDGFWDHEPRASPQGHRPILLGVSHHTVRHHLEKIYVKLGVETRMADAHIPGV